MKKTRKILILGVALWGLFSFTGCSLFNKNPQKFSYTQLEALEDTVEPLVSEYFNEKYGVKAVITYKGIAGGVFLGPDPSSVQYYLVTVNVADASIDNEYYVNVYGREVEGVDELYVKSEAYYGQVIKERIEEWLDGYVSRTNIYEHYSSFFSPTTNQFSGEYDADASAEEIIKSVSNIEDNKERPELTLYVNIPQSEYKKHFDIENEFLELKKHVNEINGKINVILNVYNDEDYLRMQNDEKSDFEQLEIIKIIDEAEQFSKDYIECEEKEYQRMLDEFNEN